MGGDMDARENGLGSVGKLAAWCGVWGSGVLNPNRISLISQFDPLNHYVRAVSSAQRSALSVYGAEHRDGHAGHLVTGDLLCILGSADSQSDMCEPRSLPFLDRAQSNSPLISKFAIQEMHTLARLHAKRGTRTIGM